MGGVIAGMKWITPLFAAALLAGCGSSSSSSSTPSSAPASSPAPASSGGGNVALSESEFKITPATATASAGTTKINVTNHGTVTHTLAVQTPTGLVKTGDIAPGSSATLTVHLSKPGKYTYFCTIPGHRQAGMVGTLTVGGGSGSGGAPAAGTTSSSGGGGSSGY